MTEPRVALSYEEHWPDLLSQLEADRAAAGVPSGARAFAQSLFDHGSFDEIGMVARRHGMNYDAGVEDSVTTLPEVPSDGVIVGTGTIDERMTVLVAEDRELGGDVRGAAAGRKATWGRSTALRHGMPLVQLFETNRLDVGEILGADFTRLGYGVDLVFESQSMRRMPKVAVVHGDLVAQSALEAANSHYVIVSEAATLGIGGAPLSADQLVERGLADEVVSNPADAIPLLTRFFRHLPSNRWLQPPSWTPVDALREPSPGMQAAEVAEAVCDAGEIVALRPRWSPEIVTGLARLEGRVIGVVAGDAFDADGCRKFARIADLCEAFALPLLVILGGSRFDGGPEAMLRLADSLRRSTVPHVVVLLSRAAQGFAPGAHIGACLGWTEGDGVDAVIAPRDTRTAVVAAVRASRIRPRPPWDDMEVNQPPPERSAERRGS